MNHSPASSPQKLKFVDPVGFTPYFAWKKLAKQDSSVEEIVCEKVSLTSIAEKVGTPTYLYSRAAIEDAYSVQGGGHPHIATGRHEHKFGLDWSEAKRLYVAHRDSKWIRWQGVSAHIGSQITTLEPFRWAFGRLAGYVAELRRAGIDVRYLDVG